MRKRLLAIVATAALVVAMVPSMVFADPVVNGDIINVANATEAQEVLDGRWGDINGKTINFTKNIDTVLDLARPTKYEGSGTTYVCNNGSRHSGESKTFTNVTEFLTHFGTSEWHTTPDYYRTLENVTFTADEGVTVAGFKFNAGHVCDECYDYVRDISYTSGSAYYKHSSLKNITFTGLTVTGQFDAKLYLEGSNVENITFEGCTFTGTTDVGNVAAIKFLADNQYFTNVVVKDCEISDYFQGVYVAGANGLEVSNNSISNTTHNAVAVQGQDNPTKGTIVIKENYMENIGDRAIRFNYVEDAKVVVNNNVMINSGDDEGELFKATDMGNGTADLENNYWDGENPSDVVKGTGVTVPTKTGITGGTFDKDVSKFLAEGYEQDPTTGKVGVEGSFDQSNDQSQPGSNATEKPASKPEASPNTGDNSVLPFAVAGIALAAMAAVVVTRRRENQ